MKVQGLITSEYDRVSQIDARHYAKLVNKSLKNNSTDDSWKFPTNYAAVKGEMMLRLTRFFDLFTLRKILLIEAFCVFTDENESMTSQV